MANLNLEVLKVPLGFIRVLEIPFIIIAFASMGGWGIHFSYTATCLPDGRVIPHENIPIDTFKLTNVKVKQDSCNETSTDEVPLFNEDISTSPGFFIFTGIVSLLFVLGVLAVYLLFWDRYQANNLLPLADFVVTALLALFWFIGTIAWWAGASAVGSETSQESIQNLLKGGKDLVCENQHECPVTVNGGYGSLVISVFAGWACVLLFAANCWFVFKETVFFRNRQPATTSSTLPSTR